MQDSDGFHHLSLHPLIKDWIQLRIGPDDFRENAFLAVNFVYVRINNCFRDDEFKLSFIARQSILPHVLAQEEIYETQTLLQSTALLNQGCRV